MVKASQKRLLTCLVLAAAVFAAFSPALRNGFTGYDDGEYVIDNVHVRSGLSRENVAWAFTSAHSSNWHPLTWISHALDCTLFGLTPAGHHLTSLLLHVANTLLLFLWLSGVTGRQAPSAFAALGFGLHPLHVESVAWVAERKDVLSTFFWILTLLAYSAYAKKPGILRYLLVAALLAAGLMSKQMLVSVPILLLVLDYWPLQRTATLGRLALEKLPLLLLSALSCAAALWAQHQGGAVAAIDQLPFTLRLSNAALSYVRYVAKMVWPADLAVFYPFPVQGIAAWKVIASLAALAAVSALVFVQRRRRPWLAAGWCWYVVTLLPVIGIVQVGMQAMADRYLYVPMIGLLIAAAWECADAWGAGRVPSRLLPAAAAAVLLTWGVLAWRQVHVWRDGLTLFEHAVAVTADNFVAHDNLGVELDRRGHADEALAHYRETLRIRPGDRHGEQNYAMANFAKGARLFGEGKSEEALAVLREGLRYRPRHALAHTYVGQILNGQQKPAAAAAEFRLALAIDPALAQAHMGLGVALASLGKALDAKREFEETLRYDASNVEAHYNLGLMLAGTGDNHAALAHFDAAIRLKPDFGPAYVARSMTLYALGMYQEAWGVVTAGKAVNAEFPPEYVAELAARVRR